VSFLKDTVKHIASLQSHINQLSKFLLQSNINKVNSCAKFLPAALALVLATESVSKTTNRGTAGLSNVYSESLW